MKRTSSNFLHSKFQQEINDGNNIRFARHCHVTPNLIRRLGLETELQGHNGCVNCLAWNEKGSLLVSGSDDVQVIVWDPFRRKLLSAIRTGHSGNIFSVKFLPQSNDNIIVTGAADCKIRVHDIHMREILHVFSCHAGRVKRLATVPDQPHLFWSASEDGTVMQFDLRNPEMCKGDHPRNVLVNLNDHIGPHAEAKCLTMSPLRPELLAVGANDPYVRVYDRRMLHCRSVVFPHDMPSRIFNMRSSSPTSVDSSSASSDFPSISEDKGLPTECVQYFVAGHLPQKQQDYRKKYRTLASTYMTFGPDGSELLVNIGGEQVYLFDVNSKRQPQQYDIGQQLSGQSHADCKDVVCESSNGYSKRCIDVSTNGFSNGVTKHITQSTLESSISAKVNKRGRYCGKPLHPAVEAIKKHANEVFEMQNYSQAIHLYNQAIHMAPNLPILYGNRAAAYLKRSWDGDVYAALRDCYSAINLDDSHLKAHFRLAKCLFELSWTDEALDCLKLFKTKFPDYAKSQTCEALEKEIRAAIFAKTEQEYGSDGASPSSHGHAPSRWMDSTADTTSYQEQTWRSNAFDYELRFCGHCNTTTDIKEANFFGSNGQFIVAGSDDGSFFIWEKATTNIMRVLRGDDSIVNCLEPHPTTCMLATSGIDPVVRLWTPQPEDGKKNDREVINSDDAASANQKRMNADPLEVMLINMGYRLPGAGGLEPDEDAGGESPVACRTS